MTDAVLKAALAEPPLPMPKRPQADARQQKLIFTTILKLERQLGAALVQAALRRYLKLTRERQSRLEQIADLQRELRELEAKERRKR